MESAVTELTAPSYILAFNFQNDTGTDVQTAEIPPIGSLSVALQEVTRTQTEQ